MSKYFEPLSDKIIYITHLNEKYALKFHDNREKFEKELNMYKLMASKCDNFNLYGKENLNLEEIYDGKFKKSNVMIGKFYDREGKYTINTFFEICRIIDHSLRKNNFIHGNMLFKNVLIKNYNVQFTSLNFSLIIDNEILILTKGMNINFYLKVDYGYKFTKNFLFIYDIFIFLLSSIQSFDLNSLITLPFNNATFIDFVTIFYLIKNKYKKLIRNKTIFASLININDIILYSKLNIDCKNKEKIQILEENHLKLKKIIVDMKELNNGCETFKKIKLCKNIFLFFENENYKILKNSEYNFKTENELKMYKIMNNLCDNFNSFDEIFKNDYGYFLKGTYDSKMIPIYDFLKSDFSDKNIITNILDIIDSKLRSNNFFHGDFKENNILVDRENINNIQIIDLEYSRILSEENKIDKYDVCLEYDGEITLSKRYLFICEMFRFVGSIPENLMFTSNEFYEMYKDKGETYFDFLVIFKIFDNFPKCLFFQNNTYSTPILKINRIILNHNFEDEKLMEHFKKMKKIINFNF